MKIKRNLIWPAIAALMVWGQVEQAPGAILPVTGWEVHNGTSVVTDGGTNSPTFTPADDFMTVMGTFPETSLVNDGDFVTVRTTLTLATRTAATGLNALNTQLRIGLFDGPAGPVVADDVPNVGIIIEYSRTGGLIREQADTAQTNPFVSPTADIGSGTSSGSSAIQGADIGPVNFELTLTRNSGLLDITGKITGTDSVSGDPYLATYSALGHTSGVGFDFNRVAFAFQGNVNAPNGTLNNVTIITPEPTSCVLAGIALIGCGALPRRSRASRHARLIRHLNWRGNEVILVDWLPGGARFGQRCRCMPTRSVQILYTSLLMILAGEVLVSMARHRLPRQISTP